MATTLPEIAGHPALQKVAEELTCPICLDTAQLPVNFVCFRGCGGRFAAGATCLRSVLCMHCANEALQLGRPPAERFLAQGGAAACLICRTSTADARTLTPESAYAPNHNVMAIMDALEMGGTCRRCDEECGSQAALLQHYLRRCPAAIVRCRFRGCAAWHTRAAAPSHEESCPVGRCRCSQCGSWVDRPELLRHTVSTCRLRVVSCMLCGHTARLPTMLGHLRLHQSQLQTQGQAQTHAQASVANGVQVTGLGPSKPGDPLQGLPAARPQEQPPAAVGLNAGRVGATPSSAAVAAVAAGATAVGAGTAAAGTASTGATGALASSQHHRQGLEVHSSQRHVSGPANADRGAAGGSAGLQPSIHALGASGGATLPSRVALPLRGGSAPPPRPPQLHQQQQQQDQQQRASAAALTPPPPTASQPWSAGAGQLGPQLLPLASVAAQAARGNAASPFATHAGLNQLRQHHASLLALSASAPQPLPRPTQAQAHAQVPHLSTEQVLQQQLALLEQLLRRQRQQLEQRLQAQRPAAAAAVRLAPVAAVLGPVAVLEQPQEAPAATTGAAASTVMPMGSDSISPWPSPQQSASQAQQRQGQGQGQVGAGIPGPLAASLAVQLLRSGMMATHGSVAASAGPPAQPAGASYPGNAATQAMGLAPLRDLGGPSDAATLSAAGEAAVAGQPAAGSLAQGSHASPMQAASLWLAPLASAAPPAGSVVTVWHGTSAGGSNTAASRFNGDGGSHALGAEWHASLDARPEGRRSLDARLEGRQSLGARAEARRSLDALAEGRRSLHARAEGRTHLDVPAAASSGAGPAAVGTSRGGIGGSQANAVDFAERVRRRASFWPADQGGSAVWQPPASPQTGLDASTRGRRDAVAAGDTDALPAGGGASACATVQGNLAAVGGPAASCAAPESTTCGPGLHPEGAAERPTGHETACARGSPVAHPVVFDTPTSPALRAAAGAPAPQPRIRRSFSDTELLHDMLDELVRASASIAGAAGARSSVSGC